MTTAGELAELHRIKYAEYQEAKRIAKETYLTKALNIFIVELINKCENAINHQYKLLVEFDPNNCDLHSKHDRDEFMKSIWIRHSIDNFKIIDKGNFVKRIEEVMNQYKTRGFEVKMEYGTVGTIFVLDIYLMF